MNKYFIHEDSKVAEALAILDTAEILGCDTETGGLDPHTCPLWSVQLCTENDGFLFPYNALSEEARDLLRPFLKSKTIIAHNAKFDVRFLQANGFEIGRVYCTKEAEKTLYAGKYFTFALTDLLHRRFQIKMDKAPRETFYNGEFATRVEEIGHWGAWDDELVEYGLGDIEYLHEIYFQQMEEARELGITNVHWLEMMLVPVVAKMENRGVWLDDKAVKKFRDKVLLRRDQLEAEVMGQLEKSFNIRWQKELAARLKKWDEWQLEHDKVKKLTASMKDSVDKRKKSEEAHALMAESYKKQPYSAKPKDNKVFNAGSTQHLCMALSQETGLVITTTAKEWLEENIDLHPSIADLVEFRKFSKLVEFCEMSDKINPATGRIHGEFNQNGARSGRFSSSNPNLQNIPARTDEAKEFRALFKPRKGYKYVGADLAGIELVILAYFSDEKILIDAINRGDDVHCFTMSNFLNCRYDVLVKAKKGLELSVTETAELGSARKAFESKFALPELVKVDSLHGWVAKLRDYTKTLTYGLVYGLSEWGLARKFHCKLEYAELFIKTFFAVYVNLKQFLRVLEDKGFAMGYAVNELGRRRWFIIPRKPSYKEIEAGVVKKLDKEKRLWDSVSDNEWQALMEAAVKEANREYNSRCRGIKRQAGNFFPQSLCAEMIKLAMWKFDRDYPAEDDTEGLVLTVHDELIAEVKEKNTDVAKQVLTDTMVYSVKKFMPNIEVKVDAKVMDVWEK